MADNSKPHVQVKFFTKQTRFSVPDTPFSVPINVAATELNALINGLLDDGLENDAQAEFDFLIDGEFLTQSLDAHLQQKEISVEDVVEIEYIERQAAPRPENSLIHDDWVSCLQASNDYILSGCYDNTARLWSTTGDLLMTIPGHTAPVKCVAWINQDDDESMFITGSHDQTLLLWRWHRQKNEVDCVCTCRGHAGSADCVAVDESKQKFCTGSWDKMLKLWSAVSQDEDLKDDEATESSTKRKKTSQPKVPTRVPMLTLSGHTEGVSSVAWLNSQEVCTASWDHTIRIWDLQEAKQAALLQGSKAFFDISYSHLNKLLIAASSDRHVRLYDPRSKDGAVVKTAFTSHAGWVVGVAWSPVNQYEFISGSHDMVMKLWDTRRPQAPLYNMGGHEDKILAVDWSIPEFMASGGADNHLKIFQYTTKKMDVS